MTHTFGKSLLITAAIGMWTAMFPSVLPAQTSGVGCDGYTRFLWRGTDSRISLWKVDANLNNPTSAQYGPYDGWQPVAMTVLCNNYTYVLWKYTDNSISLWKVDPNLNYVTTHVYGPYAGWIPESLSPDQAVPGNMRVLWRETMGYVSIWAVDSNVNFLFNKVYGPYFGFDPDAGPAAARARLSNSADPAAVPMSHPTSSTPMPQ
jgi:hypothetical protein